MPSLRSLREQFGVGRIGAGIAALDIIDAELVEHAGDRDLVGEREVDAVHLRAVAQGGVEQIEAFLAHGRFACSAANRAVSWSGCWKLVSEALNASCSGRRRAVRIGSAQRPSKKASLSFGLTWIDGRRDVRIVERADRDLDRPAGFIGQRRAAIGAEAALHFVGAREALRRAARPVKIVRGHQAGRRNRRTPSGTCGNGRSRRGRTGSRETAPRRIDIRLLLLRSSHHHR